MLRGVGPAARLIASISLLAVATPAITSETMTFAYDARGRLVTVARSGTVNNGLSASYSYDKADNRTNVTVNGSATLPGFAVSDVTVTEGGTAVFTVTKSGATPATLNVTLATADGSAHSGTDYNGTSTVLTFAPADTGKTVSVGTINNAIVDGTRVFYANLSNPSSGSTINDSQGVGTIQDDEVAVIPTFAVNDVSVTEGSGLTFTITKTGLTGTTYTVNYATANGTATAGSDYTAASGTLTFAPSETSKTVTVATTPDSTPENDETLTLNLSGPSGGATITRGSGTGTILNDDGATISISDQTVTEGAGAVLTVTKVGTTSGSITVPWATSNGTAVAPGDYIAASGTLTFSPTDTTKTIIVTTNTDTRIENPETLTVNLSQGTGTYTITRGSGTVTILDGTCGRGC
jgi:large repetitive protein